MKAQAELDQLNQAEQQLNTRCEDLNQELAAASKARGAHILESIVAGKEPDAPESRVAKIKSDLAGIEQALKQLEHRRLGAIRQAKEEAAQSERDKAEVLRAEADKHEEKTKQLLAELLKHEGVKYTIPTDGPPSARISHSEGMREQARGCIIRAKGIERELAIEDDAVANPHHYQ
jgi:DNA repair exonuclease SbcCD ATPase subunit